MRFKIECKFTQYGTEHNEGSQFTRIAHEQDAACIEYTRDSGVIIENENLLSLVPPPFSTYFHKCSPTNYNVILERKCVAKMESRGCTTSLRCSLLPLSRLKREQRRFILAAEMRNSCRPHAQDRFSDSEVSFSIEEFNVEKRGVIYGGEVSLENARRTKSEGSEDMFYIIYIS